MSIKRLFTANGTETLDNSRFTSRSIEVGKDSPVTIKAPADWSTEAVSAFSEAFYQRMPLNYRPVEENTLPSWLWQRRSAETETGSETNVLQVFDRIAGSATYAGWKRNLWDDEEEAKIFYDEIRHILTHRIIAIEPKKLTEIGIEWAYGIKQKAINKQDPLVAPELESWPITDPVTGPVSVRNSTIDSLIRGARPLLRARWQKFIHGSKSRRMISLRFADTSLEWNYLNTAESTIPGLVLDLLKFRSDENVIDLTSLVHSVRLSVILLELIYDQWPSTPEPARPLAVGFVNMGALLLSHGIPYNSKEARLTAAAISAIITAEAVSASAMLAEQYGVCLGFLARREATLRALRNHRRAAHGETNDYERLSILPVPLTIEDGADLVLISAARHAWDVAVEKSQKHGLRHLQLTSLHESPEFLAFLECSAQSIEPEMHLVRQCLTSSNDPECFRRTINPVVPIALKKAGCSEADIKNIISHAIGRGTLEKAPGVNHERLRELGFEDDELQKVESYLPCVSDIRTAFTPWILGEEFCFSILKINENDLQDPAFDMLKFIGFSDEDIAAANSFCCGYGTVIGAPGMTEKAEKLFSPANYTAEARIMMAAAVQSFITGDVNLVISLPLQTSSEARANLFLSAWRQGLKSMSIYLEGFLLPEQSGLSITTARIQRKILKWKTPAIPTPIAAKPLPRHDRSLQKLHLGTIKQKATTRAVSMRRQHDKPGSSVSIKKD